MITDSTEREVAAYICTHVFKATHPVLLVAREQGDWMFLCGGFHYSENEFHLAGKNHLLERDGTLQDIMNLDNGQEAERSCVGGAWTRRDIED